MKLEVALPCSQDPATGTYPEPDESTQSLPCFFSNNVCYIILPCKLRSSEWFLPLGFLTKTVYEFLYIPRTKLHSVPRLILLDLITVITFGEEYKL